MRKSSTLTIEILSLNSQTYKSKIVNVRTGIDMGLGEAIVTIIGILAVIVIGILVIKNVYLVVWPEQPLFIVLVVIAVILVGFSAILSVALRR
jgi:hypothetical protein